MRSRFAAHCLCMCQEDHNQTLASAVDRPQHEDVHERNEEHDPAENNVHESPGPHALVKHGYFRCNP